MDDIDLLTEEFESALLQINRVKAAAIFERCFNQYKSFDFLERLTINTLERIGEGCEKGTVALSQVYISGIICEELVDEYLSKIETKRKDVPRMAIAVLQDYHGLGKRMVYSLLRASGYQVQDFGQGMSVEDLVEQTIGNDIELLLISTLMLPSALKVRAVREELSKRGAKAKIIVGGEPFRADSSLWQRVGADGQGSSAADIIASIERVMTS